jgi:hypothetical protein
MPLRHLLDIVAATFCLDNFCIIHHDAFDINWARKVEMEMQTKVNGKLGDFQNKYMPHIACRVKAWLGYPKGLSHEISNGPPHLNMSLKFNDTFILKVCFSS